MANFMQMRVLLCSKCSLWGNFWNWSIFKSLKLQKLLLCMSFGHFWTFSAYKVVKLRLKMKMLPIETRQNTFFIRKRLFWDKCPSITTSATPDFWVKLNLMHDLSFLGLLLTFVRLGIAIWVLFWHFR